MGCAVVVEETSWRYETWEDRGAVVRAVFEVQQAEVSFPYPPLHSAVEEVLELNSDLG